MVLPELPDLVTACLTESGDSGVTRTVLLSGRQRGQGKRLLTDLVFEFDEVFDDVEKVRGDLGQLVHLAQ